MHATGDYTIADLMEVFSTGRATVYRVLERASTQPPSPGRRGAMTPGVRRTRSGLADWPAISRE